MSSNLEIGVQRAMIAALVASGVNQEGARARVTPSKVAAGVSFLKSRFSQAYRGRKRDGESDETCWSQAFQALKSWTPENT